MTRNKLTLVPYYVVLVMIMVYWIAYLAEGTIELSGVINNYAYFIVSTVSCFFWCNVILITTFEWNLISLLVRF